MTSFTSCIVYLRRRQLGCIRWIDTALNREGRVRKLLAIQNRMSVYGSSTPRPLAVSLYFSSLGSPPRAVHSLLSDSTFVLS